MDDARTPTIEVQFRNDQWRQEGAKERTDVVVDEDLASLFAYARCWAADEDRADRCDLTFSAMLAAMVAHEQPLCRWLNRYFDALGVPSDDITKGRSYPGASLYSARAGGENHLATTISFRAAFAMAGELRDLASPGQSIGVRHFMAAYAVCPDYHLRDFRRYRIDRREWCLELADELSRRFPHENAGWALYASMAPALLPLAFDNDTPDGRDRMHLEREVEAFARLIAARSTSTPLSIGVFGAWGSGKSFFMRRTRERVAALAADSADNGARSEHHARIAQVEFNAWHYSETALIASMVDHMFRNLRIDAIDEDDETLRRRGAELMALLGAAKQGLASTEACVAAAASRLKEADANLTRAQQALPEAVGLANRELAMAEYAEREARTALDQLRAERNEAVGKAQTMAAATAWIDAIGDDTTRRAIGDASEALVALANDARSTRRRWKPILIGAGVITLTITFAALARTRMWTQVLGGVGAITAFATIARTWLVRLRELSDRGDRFLDAKEQATQAASERASAGYAEGIGALEAQVEATRNAALVARAHLEATAETHDAIDLLDKRREELAAVRDLRARAQRDVDDLSVAVDQTSIDTLLREFLDQLSATDSYRKQLGIFSQVRNDFERLSKLIARATADHFDHGAPPPAVSRIVLYIDDLDRCSEDKVVEVLRAVHLLLAFPLFVCVVAVDPRWLTTCLSRAPGVAGAATALDAQFGKPADAADYIEKIFQVPIWLRPVPEDQRSALLRSWLESDDTAVVTEQPPMTTAELDFLDELVPFLDGKPRTLKRLANTYRLVKTALSDVEFRTFTSDDRPVGTTGGHYRPYRMCVTQLAVLSANRDRAIAMIESLDGEKTQTTVGAWLDRFKAVDSELATFLGTTLAPVGDLDLAEFRRWLERTRRYSFYL